MDLSMDLSMNLATEHRPSGHSKNLFGSFVAPGHYCHDVLVPTATQAALMLTLRSNRRELFEVCFSDTANAAHSQSQI